LTFWSDIAIVVGMASRNGPVHVVTTRRQYKGRVYTTHLLRRSFREGGKVRNETLGNLSHLPDALVDMVRRGLRGEEFVAVRERFEIVASRPHGDTAAVLRAMRRLDIAGLLGARPCREADMVMAMIVARIVAPHTKLATTRWWHSRTLADDLGVADADEDDLYGAMDWLLARQDAIERKLAARHLTSGGLALYDLTSSYFEGSHCPLAARGYSRDGRKGKLQVNWGLLADRRGCPVAVSVFEGNTADPATLLPQADRLRQQFGLDSMVLVGDRGMISTASIEPLRAERFGWITALKSGQIRSLLHDGALQMDLFDERNLFELHHPDYPGERLVACRNPALAKRRAYKRTALLEATIIELDKVRAMVARGTLRGAASIGVRVGKALNKYKVAKHFELAIDDESFGFTLRHDKIAEEAALDGLYVIRTSLEKRRMTADDAVRNYKALTAVERAFRSLKTVDLKVRPIHHRLEDRVRAHIFLCMLAYYVEWHIRQAWRELMFADEDQDAKSTRDPVAPARRSDNARDKIASRTRPDATPLHCFHTLLDQLATIVRNTCRVPGHTTNPTFDIMTTPNSLQRRAAELIDAIVP
jgi:DDE family transposase